MSQERVMLPIDKIEVSQVALRSAQTESEGFQHLQASIETYGIMNNLAVRPSKTAEGMYTLIDGLQRFTIANLIGIKELPVVILDADEQQALLLQVQGNIQSIVTKPAEYAKQLVRILKLSPDMTLSELAETVCQKTDWVSARLALLKLHPDIQKMVDDGVINLSNARKLAMLDQEEQKQWVKRAIEMPSDEFVPACTARIMELRKASREGGSAGPEEFVPMPKQRSKGDIQKELEKPTVRNVILTKDTTPAQAWKEALAWSLSLDEQTVNEAKTKWEADKAAREARKAEKEAAKKAAQEAKAAELENAVL